MKNKIKLLSIVTGLVIYPLTAYPTDVSNTYSVPSSSLSKALTQFGDQANIKLVFNPAITKNITSNAINGKYTVLEALNHLLNGSGLSYRVVDNNVFVIEPRPVKNTPVQESSSTSTLPVVNVVGKGEYDATDPYNEDYALPNATAGTKTDTPIIETPLNVQVISKQVLKDQQAITLGDALKNVSGVVINSEASTGNFITLNGGLSATNITLRGFASQTYFRNGFRLQQGAGARELANVESIEVLKGPAAILYGLVEPGGLVNVVTKQPQATPYYALNQQFGSFDNYRTTADATGPLAGREDLLYRLNFSYQTTGGFQDFTGKDDVFVAPVLTWIISPKTQATVELEYNRQHTGLGNAFNPYLNGQITPIPLNQNYSEYSPAVTETYFGGVNWSHQFNEDWTLKHRFSVNQQNFSNTFYPQPIVALGPDFLSIFSGQPATNFSGFNVLRQNVGSLSQNNTYATNLDVIGHFDTAGLQHTLLLGGDYYRVDNVGQIIRTAALDQLSIIAAVNPVHPGTSLNLGNDSSFGNRQQFDQYGLYLQDQIKLPYDFHFTGGFRYQNLHQATQNTGADGSVTSNAALSSDAITPRVGLLWHPQNWISLYVNYSESFGPNPGLVFSDTGNFSSVAPSNAKQYEGGIKTEFFDGRLRTTLAYYDLTKTNVSAGDPIHQTQCGGPCSLAIGEVRSRGPELDIQGELLPGWNAIATWANVDVLITKTNADNTPLDNGNGTVLNVGDRLINVPRNIASFWTTYEFQEGDFKGFKLGGGVNVQEGQIGSRFGNLSGLPAGAPAKVPGFATLNLLAAYSYDVGKAKVTAQLNVSNVLDKRYFTNINGSNNDPVLGAFGAYAAYGAPRTFLGSISIQY